MKWGIISLLAVSVGLFGGSFAFGQEDISQHPECIHCGMDRQQFSHSRMLIEYEDGTIVGLCSIRCAAVDLEKNSEKTPNTILVADYNAKKLIKAEDAFWVMGGSQRGVMTRNPKWAFERKQDADAFIAEFGGESVTFEKAISAAKEELAARRK